MASPRNKELVVVWDFDWSFINENSDTYIIEQLAPDLIEEMKELKRSGWQWTDLMDHMVKRLHDKGFTKRDFVDCLSRIPIFPEVVQVSQYLADHTTMYIISDANTFYIDTILESLGIRELFASIETNPANWVASVNGETLSISHHQRDGPHGCPYCSVNICKGKILDKLIGQGEDRKFTRVAYVGDGSGDFCPCTKLQSDDLVLARSGYPLLRKLSDPNMATFVGANVVEWGSGDELERELMAFIR